MSKPPPTRPPDRGERLTKDLAPSNLRRPMTRSVVTVWAAMSVVILGSVVMTDVSTSEAWEIWLWSSVIVVLLGLATRVRDLERFITERQVALVDQHERLHRAALTDPMTGLPNRRHLMDRLEQEVARSQRHGQALACLFLDVDNFAQINNTYLHEAGDAILASLGGVLRRQLRTSDVLARYGGDEFVILLPGVEPDQLGHVAERIRCAVERHRFRALPPHEPVTVSVGVSVWDGQVHEDPDALLRAADEALYRAKESGRNAVGLADALAERLRSGKVSDHGVDSRDEPAGSPRAASGGLDE